VAVRAIDNVAGRMVMVAKKFAVVPLVLSVAGL